MIVWMGVIAALAGAVVGGSIALINSRLQLREQRKRERNKLILSKLEEIHEVLSEFRESYKASLLERISSIGNSKAQDIKESQSKVPIEKLRMLVGFYAPELSDNLQRVEEARGGYGSVLIKTVGIERENEESQKKLIRNLFTEEIKIGKTCTEMQVEVVKLSKNYL